MTAVDMDGEPSNRKKKQNEGLLTLLLLGFYERMSSFAQFGPMYRRIQTCHVARGANGAVEVLTQVRGADSDIPKCVCAQCIVNGER